MFEEYLKEIHAKNYMGTDDDMPDEFDNWLGSLDGEDYMRYADDMLTQFTTRMDESIALQERAIDALKAIFK